MTTNFKNRKTKLDPQICGDGVDEDLLYEEKEFFYALGRAVSEWSQVENRLFLLYMKIVNSDNMFAMSATYYSVTMFSNKLNMVDKSFRACFYHETEVATWSKLMDKINSLSKQRNQIVHLPTTYNILKENGSKVYISPEIGNFNASIEKKHFNPKYIYNTGRLEQLANQFENLTREIHQFVINLPYPKLETE